MNIRELLKHDAGIEVRISGGTGRRDDPYVIEECSKDEAALTQVQLLQGIGNGLGEIWRIIDWRPCDIGSATEVIQIEALRFTQTEIETSTRNIYFNTQFVSGNPYKLHPLTAWQGSTKFPVLPFELGWLHFVNSVSNSSSEILFDQMVFYSGAGAKATVYIYSKQSNGAGATRDAELERVAAMVVLNPELEEPGPRLEVGPFAMKFFISADDITAAGVAEFGAYFIKVRLTFFDDLKMRELMLTSLNVLAACVESALSAHQ
jgi:hypothetical protein